MTNSATHSTNLTSYGTTGNADSRGVSTTRTVPNAEEFQEHVRTYRHFVMGFGLFAAHLLVILLLLYLFLMA